MEKRSFETFEVFSCLKKVNPRILSTFKRSYSLKKMGKTPSSHIIHSLGGEYCWIVRDNEPIRLLKSPRRSLSVHTAILREFVGKSVRDNPERYFGWFCIHSSSSRKFWKNGTRGRGRMFVIAKGKQQKWIRQLQCHEHCIGHIPYHLPGLLRAHFFWQPFSK